MGAMAHTPTPMRDWPQGRVTTADGFSLRWFRSGGAASGGAEALPPLLLVHGFTDNALYYTRTAEALAQRWDVVAYDARGHGASDRAGERFDDEVRVNDLVCVVESLGLDRPAMIGHSMGAATIALALAAHPGVARAAVLEDPAWWEPPVAATHEEAASQRAARLERNKAWQAATMPSYCTNTMPERDQSLRAENAETSQTMGTPSTTGCRMRATGNSPVS